MKEISTLYDPRWEDWSRKAKSRRDACEARWGRAGKVGLKGWTPHPEYCDGEVYWANSWIGRLDPAGPALEEQVEAMLQDFLEHGCE